MGLYLGVILAFISPVLAFMSFMFGHFYRWQVGKFLLPIVLESTYTLVLDQFAMSRGIWHIYDASGIRFPIHLFGNRGLQLEQFLIYSLTTVLVVGTLHPMLLISKAYYQWEVKRPFPSFFFDMIKTDGQAPEAEAFVMDESMPEWKPIADGIAFLDTVEGVLQSCMNALGTVSQMVVAARKFLKELQRGGKTKSEDDTASEELQKASKPEEASDALPHSAVLPPTEAVNSEPTQTQATPASGEAKEGCVSECGVSGDAKVCSEEDVEGHDWNILTRRR